MDYMERIGEIKDSIFALTHAMTIAEKIALIEQHYRSLSKLDRIIFSDIRSIYKAMDSGKAVKLNDFDPRGWLNRFVVKHNLFI